MRLPVHLRPAPARTTPLPVDNSHSSPAINSHRRWIQTQTTGTSGQWWCATTAMTSGTSQDESGGCASHRSHSISDPSDPPAPSLALNTPEPEKSQTELIELNCLKYKIQIVTLAVL
ncbi:hypothetical protein JMJ55_28705 [Belnapia sp. T6]|uniref:Uncharacterized protein n=1 Tax=Belnapia mucosa TaxID=2804532 RepID=A0ABS1VCE9_9PROT|nr:hypothetical protein [Belnapia mucosa]